LQDVHGDVQLFSVYVPTNHIYVGDVFMLGKQDIIKVNLSVREGLGEQSQSPCLQIGHITLVLSLRTDPTYSNPFAWTLATWPETCVHLHHCSHCILRLEFVVLLSLLRFQNVTDISSWVSCRNRCISWHGATSEPDVYPAMKTCSIGGTTLLRFQEKVVAEQFQQISSKHS